MNILLVGGNTQNKGAFLMILAMIEQLKSRYPTCTISISPIVKDISRINTDSLEVLNFPLFHVSDPKLKYALKFPKLIQSLFKNIKGKNLYGKVKIKDIDVVFDISGFAFSDQFSEIPLQGLASLAAYFNKRNVPIILMPQALGPFEKYNAAAKFAFSKVDLIFARDEISFEHAKNLLPSQHKKIHRSYDITLSLKPSVQDHNIEQLKGDYVTIVPNHNMLSRAAESWKNNYIKALFNATNIILEQSDFDIVLLVHNDSNSPDHHIANDVKKHFEDHSRVKVVQHSDPLILKKIIKESVFLIGSRFHSLVSALSTNTPCISTSWAHKYEELFKDYNIGNRSFKEYALDFDKCVTELLDVDTRNKMIEILQPQNEAVLNNNNDMWKIISETIACNYE